METAGGKRDVVEPQVRAHVSSLVTALGGSGADEDGQYVLGDDALACLRDLKKWLKLYDEKANRLDVARCLAESNLVGGDLLQILAAWPENATDDRLKSKIALSCLELLVPLTWPLEKNKQEMTVNHYRHIPFLELAQLGYKRSIINFDGARILHTAVRCALPSMAESLSERSTRDEGIIKLLLYFLRNIAMIATPPNVSYEGDEAEISRSATIDAFDYQDILHVLLTVSSTMGEEFNTQDVVIMDILFYLIKGIDINKLFMDQTSGDNSKMNELVRLRTKEAAMLRSYQMNAPSRHNRFGTMAWLQRDDAKMTTIAGQAAMTDSTRGLAKMDSTKKYKPPRRALKGEHGPMDFDTPVLLKESATKHLRAFVENFLDSGFNPLFSHIRKAIDREAERVLEYHPRQFFYLVSWLLEAERVRRRTKKHSKSQGSEDLNNFSLIASVLNQEMFVTLNRAMDSNFENKSWTDLSAAMKCFSQILLTVQDMSESPLEEDQEIAENILSRIFYEETTHDRVATITRTYKDQGFGYLDSCTELTHTYLRILEQYSKQNVDMQVRSRRRVRRKNKAARAAGQGEGEDGAVDESEGEDEVRAERVTSERKFDFKRFAARFVSQGCVDTFVKFLSYYNDLNPSQLKRGHRFFYRVAFKQEMSVMLFRVDIIALLYRMIKGPEGLDPALSSFKEWDELVKQVLKRCTRKIQERPELVVEMLFSKINSTAHYLEYGYEKQTITSIPRAAAELQVKGDMGLEEQIGIVVSALLDRNDGDHLEWVKLQLQSAEIERRSWETANQALQTEEQPTAIETTETTAVEVQPLMAPLIAVRPDSIDRKTAVFKNGHLRLLMTLVSIQRTSELDDPDSAWAINSSVSVDQLKQSLDLIKKFEFSPPVFDDGQEAIDFIRRKPSTAANRTKAAFDDEDDIIDDDGEEEFLFEPGGPTNMKKSDAIQELKKNRRRKRRQDSEDDGERLSDEQLKARADARREKEREKNRKIKSDLYVHDSDEEDPEADASFWAEEEKRRDRNKINIMKELLGVAKKANNDTTMETRTRLTGAMFDGSDPEDAPAVERRKRPSSAISIDSDENAEPVPRDNLLDDSEEEALDTETDTPASSPHTRSSQSKRRKIASDEDGEQSNISSAAGQKMTDKILLHDEEDEEDIPVARSRQRFRAGFVMDSSDEE